MHYPSIPRPWQGLKFQIPYPPKSTSRFTLDLGIRDRGGRLVGPGEDADVVVLPEQAAVRARRPGRAEWWHEAGAVVMWEQAFLRTLNGRP